MHIHSFRSPAPARFLFALLSIGWAATAQTSQVKGRVESGGIPVSGASTSIYVAGHVKNAPAQLLATATQHPLHTSLNEPAYRLDLGAETHRQWA